MKQRVYCNKYVYLTILIAFSHPARNTHRHSLIWSVQPIHSRSHAGTPAGVCARKPSQMLSSFNSCAIPRPRTMLFSISNGSPDCDYETLERKIVNGANACVSNMMAHQFFLATRRNVDRESVARSQRLPVSLQPLAAEHVFFSNQSKESNVSTKPRWWCCVHTVDMLKSSARKDC